jgi:hypothetical protein
MMRVEASLKSRGMGDWYLLTRDGSTGFNKFIDLQNQ